MSKICVNDKNPLIADGECGRQIHNGKRLSASFFERSEHDDFVIRVLGKFQVYLCANRSEGIIQLVIYSIRHLDV